MFKKYPNPDGINIADIGDNLPNLNNSNNNINNVLPIAGATFGTTVNGQSLTSSPNPANFTGCHGAINFTTTAGDNVILSCHSADIQVISHNPNNPPIFVTYTAKDGTQGIANLVEGDKLIFNPISPLLTSPSTNVDYIMVIRTSDNYPILLSPGQSRYLSANDLHADAGGLYVVNGGDKVTLNGTLSTDGSNNHTLSYLWKQVSGPAVTLNGFSTALPTFIAPIITNSNSSLLQFMLTVTDSSRLTDSDSAFVFVNGTNNSNNSTNNNNGTNGNNNNNPTPPPPFIKKFGSRDLFKFSNSMCTC